MKQAEFVEKLTYFLEKMDCKVIANYEINATVRIEIRSKDDRNLETLFLKFHTVYGYGGTCPISEIDELRGYIQEKSITAHLEHDSIIIDIVKLKGDC